ncbi:phosphomevalonate kinase [Streptomyces sp. NPDC003691]
MTGRGTVSRSAPGKLFVLGEYAVLEPGVPALLTTVDRRARVTVSRSPDPGVVVDSDLCPHRVRLRRSESGLTGLGPEDERLRRDRLSHLASAVEVVEQLLAGRGPAPGPLRVSVRSELHRHGTKLGLGSSGAVTVAAVAAVAAHYGLELPPEARFRLAMLATARLGARSSGGDLAASVWGGWLEYRAPDRTAVLDTAERRGVAETMSVPWPGFGVRRIPPPRGLALKVGWTGRPARTPSLTEGLGKRERRGGGSSWQDFVERSEACVNASVRALERGDDHEVLRRVGDARGLLAGLDDRLGLGVFTPELTAMCDVAEALGGAAKPSGAGGGDCGIALLDASSGDRTSVLREGWAASGVSLLPLRTQSVRGERNDC